MLEQKGRKGIVFAAALLFACGAMAQDKAQDKAQWDKNHPRRAEVNKRLENQNARIRKEEKSGEITKAQAQQLHKEDHQIRQQERSDAAKHGGHITKGEQRQLNKEENAVSRQIGK